MIFELIHTSQERYYYCRSNHLAIFPIYRIQYTRRYPIDDYYNYPMYNSQFYSDGSILMDSFDSGSWYASPDEFLNNEVFCSGLGDGSGYLMFSDFYEGYSSVILKDNLPAILNFSDNGMSTIHAPVKLLDISDFDDKGLYPELLDNSQQRADAVSYILDTNPNKELDPAIWDDTYLKFCHFIEEYNKNVLLLRSTRKVSIDDTVLTASTDSGSSVNLSGVENKLQNINNSLDNIKDNLQYTDTDDITKGLAEIEYDKIETKPIVVETVEKAPFNPYLDKDNNDIYGV